MSDQTSDRIGQQFANYRLTRLVGVGGFAEVYLGEHIHLDSLAAIKLLNQSIISRDLSLFLCEARTIAALDHPAIIRVMDCGVEHNEPFIIMQYAPNGTLRQRHPRGYQVPLAQVVPYVEQLAHALDYAHEHKIIHRDIKPENMLIGSQQQILLSDFGIALVTSSAVSQQGKKAASGTVAYMAPEQIMGLPRPASDQYALGVVVYEWLAGELPFQGSLPEMYGQHLHARPPALCEKNRSLPLAVAEVVGKALAKDPDQRFASVREFAQELRRSMRSSFIISSDSSTSFSHQSSLSQARETALSCYVRPHPELIYATQQSEVGPGNEGSPHKPAIALATKPEDLYATQLKAESSVLSAVPENQRQTRRWLLPGLLLAALLAFSLVLLTVTLWHTPDRTAPQDQPLTRQRSGSSTYGAHSRSSKATKPTATVAGVTIVTTSPVTPSGPQNTFAQPICLSGQTPVLNFTIKDGQGDPDLQTTTLSNGPGCGGGTWSISVDNGWLLISRPVTGTIEAGEMIQLAVGVDSTNLSVGEYVGHIKITTNAGSSTIMVRLRIQPVACMMVGANELDFTAVQGSNPPTQTLPLLNCGSTGTYSASGDALKWTQITPNSGPLTPQQPVTVAFSPAVSSWSPGVYSGIITFIQTTGSQQNMRSVFIKVTISATIPMVVTPTATPNTNIQVPPPTATSSTPEPSPTATAIPSPPPTTTPQTTIQSPPPTTTLQTMPPPTATAYSTPSIATPSNNSQTTHGSLFH
ncbi:serine/threonine protein kinase [Tengunoibacter tsumagoiensis]|nr:serine/threonine-protein kinase [Tengunoibacter tsumagoiensis]